MARVQIEFVAQDGTVTVISSVNAGLQQVGVNAASASNRFSALWSGVASGASTLDDVRASLDAINASTAASGNQSLMTAWSRAASALAEYRSELEAEDASAERVAAAQQHLAITLRQLDDAQSQAASGARDLQAEQEQLADSAQTTADRAAALGLRFDEASGRWRNSSGQFASAAQLAAAGIERTGQAADQTGSKLKQAGDQAQQAGQQAAGSGGLWDRLRGVLGGVGSGLGSVARLLGGAALGGLTALAVGLGGAGMAGLSFNNSLEQTRAQIMAFTKDAAQTEQILAMVQARAASTPFSFEAMATAAASLIPVSKQAGMSLEELISTAEILAALNPAEGLEGAAFALREAVSGDFESVIERFNLPRQRLNQLKAEGVPAIEAVRRAMAEMGIDASLVAGLSQTLTGRWSTFLDTLVSVASTATQPIFDVLSSGLGDLNAVLAENAPGISRLAGLLGQQMSTAVRAATSALAPLTNALTAFLRTLTAGGSVGDAFIAGLNRIIPGLGNLARSLFGWGAGLVQQFASGMTSAFGLVQGVINQLGGVIAALMQPHSPPAFLPEIDLWGRDTAQTYLDAFGTADPGPGVDELRGSLLSALGGMQTDIAGALRPVPLVRSLFDLSGDEAGFLSNVSDSLRTVLKAMQDVGQVPEQDVIPRLLGSRELLQTAINDMRVFGSISEDTLRRISSSFGPLAPQVGQLVRAYGDLKRATDDVRRAQDELNRVTAEYDAKLKPLNDELKKIQDQKKAIDDQQRLKDLQDKIASGELDDLETKKAQLEIEEIQARQRIDAVEAERDVAVDAAKQKVDAAKEAQSAAQQQVDVAKAQIDALAQQNALIREQADLLERLKGAGGSGGGGGGAGGLALPKAATTPTPAAPAAPSAAEQRYADFKTAQGDDKITPQINAQISAVERLAGAFAPLRAAWEGVQSVGATAAASLTLIGQNVASIFAGASGSAQAAVGSIGAAWNGLAPMISAAVVPISSIVQSALGAVNAFLWENGPQITQFVSTTWTQVASIISGAMQLAGGVVVGTLQWISEWFVAHSSTIQLVLTGAWQVITGIITGALALIQGAIQTALNLMQGNWTGAWQAFQSMSVTVVQSLGQIISVGLDAIARQFGTSLDAIKQTWGDSLSLLVTIASRAMTDTISTLAGFVVKAKSVGSDIVGGIVAGVTGAAGALMSAMRDLARSALNEAKAALGISSPSKAMEEIAQWIPPGAAAGVLKTGSVLFEAMRSLMSTAASTASEDARKVIEAVLAAGGSLLRDRAAGVASTRQLAPDTKTRDAAAKGAQEAQAKLSQLDAQRVGLRAALEDATDPEEQRRLARELADLDLERARAAQALSEAQVKQAEAARAYEAQLNLQKQVQSELAEALRQSQQITDPRAAAEYYRMRQQQILELAQLQQQLQQATDADTRASIQAQIALIRQADAVDVATFQTKQRNAGNNINLPVTAPGVGTPAAAAAAAASRQQSISIAAGAFQITVNAAQGDISGQIRRGVADALASLGVDIDGRARVR